MVEQPDIATGGYLACDPSKGGWGWAYADPRAIAAWPEIAIGKCVGPVDGVVFGVRSFKDWPYCQFVFRASRFLHDLCERFRPAAIFSEGVVFNPARDSAARAEIMYGAKALVTVHGCIRGIEPTFIEPTTAKLNFTGTGKASKDDMVATARRRGWKVDDDNVADALAILNSGVLLQVSLARAGKMRARVDAALGATG